MRAVAISAFFLSGFAGLVYEVCWIRMASLVFGSTTVALSTVVAIFFAGLALGSWAFGRIAQASARPLRLYAQCGDLSPRFSYLTECAVGSTGRCNIFCFSS